MTEDEILIERLSDLLITGKVRQTKTKEGYSVEIVHETQHESMRVFNVITDIIERA